MAESLDHAEVGPARHMAVGEECPLVVGTLACLAGAVQTLDDLQRAGFALGEMTFVARVDSTGRSEEQSSQAFSRFGTPRVVACHGLGTLRIGGGGLQPLRALRSQVSLGDLGRAFADAGLPDADTLIYELGLIRGQCLLAVRAATDERGQIAYRLLLRGGSQEVHVYRP